MSGRREQREEQAEEQQARAAELESTSRAKPVPGPESSVEQRVDYIAGEMSEGRWDGYVSRVRLAAAWGVVEATVRHYSAEAHRLVAYDDKDREEKRRSLAAFVGRQRERASTMVSFNTGLPDFASALKAAELEAKFAGIELEPTRKLELSGKGGGPIETKQHVTYDEVLSSLSRLAADGGAGAPDPEPEPEGS